VQRRICGIQVFDCLHGAWPQLLGSYETLVIAEAIQRSPDRGVLLDHEIYEIAHKEQNSEALVTSESRKLNGPTDVEEFPLTSRKVLASPYLEELSYLEIGRLTNLPPGKIISLARRRKRWTVALTNHKYVEVLS
jgi:hypothetical protein